jgi:hypothetical protein
VRHSHPPTRQRKTMKIHAVAFLVAATLLFVAYSTSSARPQNSDASKCSPGYEDHNQIDYGPLKVTAVQGTSVIRVGDQERPAVSGACFVLFSEKDHVLMASVVAGTDGRFELKHIPPGRYRLIARARGFCTANVPLEIVKSARKKQEIRVNFRPTGIDTCSYGELVALE